MDKENNFLTNRERNDFLGKFGTIGSTERTAVSGRAFLCYF